MGFNCNSVNNALFTTARLVAGTLGGMWAGRSVQWLYKLWQEAGTERMLSQAGYQAMGTAGLHVLGGIAVMLIAYKVGNLMKVNQDLEARAVAAHERAVEAGDDAEETAAKAAELERKVRELEGKLRWNGPNSPLRSRSRGRRQSLAD